MSEDEIHPALTAQQRNRENQYYLYDPVLLAIPEIFFSFPKMEFYE